MTSRAVPMLGLVLVVGVALAAAFAGTGSDTSYVARAGEVAPGGAAPPTRADDPWGAEGPLTSSPASTATAATIPVLRSAPPLEDLDGWLQSDVTTLEELEGKVVVLQFWTFGCNNCKNTLPHLQELAERHDNDEFEVVGVHAPEFDYEKDPVAIQEAADRLGVTWPIALDTDRSNFRSWQGSPAYWPRTYVIDAEGNIRFDHIGEGAYDELAETVAQLLGET